jgi:phosphate:Na+ symporter
MAAVHTIFNLVTTLFFLPFSKRFASLIERLIKIDPSMKPHLSALNMTSFIAPVIACDQALLEVQFMRDSNLELLSCLKKVLAGESDYRTEEHIIHREAVLDNVQKEVTEFLGKIMVKRAPTEVSARVKRLLRMSDELESVSDETATILRAVRRLRKGGQKFSPQSQRTLEEVHDKVAASAEKISGFLRSPRPKFDLALVETESQELGDFIRECRRRQLDRVGPDDPGSPTRVLAELDILNAYERIRSYYLNIAEILAGGKQIDHEALENMKLDEGQLL